MYTSLSCGYCLLMGEHFSIKLHHPSHLLMNHTDYRKNEQTKHKHNILSKMHAGFSIQNIACPFAVSSSQHMVALGNLFNLLPSP